MDQILVNFVMQNGTNAEVKVPKNIIVEDAIEQLVSNGVIEALKADHEWCVSFKESNEMLDLDKTMEENGVADGTALRVTQIGQA